MTIGLFVTLKVLPGKNKAFEAAFAEQAANCKAKEPGQQLYKLFRSQTDPQTYHIMEMYNDAAALDAHRNGAHMGITRPRVRETLDGPLTVVTLDGV